MPENAVPDPGTRPVDAVMCPVSLAGGGGVVDKIYKLKDHFASTFGGKMIYVRNQGHEYFITTDPADTMLYPTDHPQAKQPRYDWTDAGNGVRLGYLKQG